MDLRAGFKVRERREKWCLVDHEVGPRNLTQDDYGRETLKPKVSGWAANRRFRIVDFPEPDGPEMTIGRRSDVAAGSTIRSGFSERKVWGSVGGAANL